MIIVIFKLSNVKFFKNTYEQFFECYINKSKSKFQISKSIHSTIRSSGDYSIKVFNNFCQFHIIRSERVQILSSLTNKEISKISIKHNSFSWMINICSWKEEILFFFRVELNSIEWIFDTFHSCYKWFSIPIITYRSRSKHRFQSFIILECIHWYPIWMNI